MRALKVIAPLLLLFTSYVQAAEHKVHLTLKGGHLYIPCSIGGHGHECLLDTGATISVIDDRLYLGASPVTGTVDEVFVGGNHAGKLVRIIVEIGGAEVEINAAAIKLRPEIEIDIIIGEDVLSRLKSVLIDYKNKVVVFED